MSQVTTSENTDAALGAVQLTLSSAEAQQLRITVPWLLRALADRPTTPARQLERRRKASAALEALMRALSSQTAPAEEAVSDSVDDGSANGVGGMQHAANTNADGHSARVTI
jgi:hypothetical protein